MFDIDVFNRTTTYDKIISNSTYNFIIGAVLSWGFLVSWFLVTNIDTTMLKNINNLVFFGGYMLFCFAGIYTVRKSENPYISFLGYNLIVVPFGLVLNIVLSHYAPGLIIRAIQITGCVTLVMMFVSSLFPNFFSKIGGALTIALLTVIFVELIQFFIFHTISPILDWVIVVIFCGYIGYDWGRANQIPKTVNNAVDSAAALYIDIINLFLTILRIMSRSRK